LTSHFVASLFREVDKAKKVEKGLQLYSDDKLFKELKKRVKSGYDIYNPDHNFYDRFIDDLKDDSIQALQAELDARNAEYQELKFKLQKFNQPDLGDKI